MSVKRKIMGLRRGFSVSSDLFNSNILLTDKLSYKSAAYRLRKIGLTLKTEHQRKRSLIHNPLIISVIIVLYLIKCLVYLNSSDKQISIYFGEFSAFVDLGFHFDGVTLIFFSMILISQYMYWLNYKRGVRPTFMKVFHMMAGFVTPASVGLTDLAQVKILINRTKGLFFFMDVVLKVTVPALGSVMILLPYYQYCELQDLYLYGVPNAVHFVISCYHCGINFYQFLYFYLICYYLKIKIRNINHKFLEILKTKKFGKIQKLLRGLDEVYTEIDDYNRSYFSKFLLLFWLTIGSVFVLLLFGAIFNDERIVYKILFYYNSGLFAGCIALVIFTASSLNHEANNSYKILNSMISTNYRHLFFRKMTSLSTKFKVNVFIARISDHRIGFTCGKLFTIDYFRSYELIAFTCVLFLKIIEISNNAKEKNLADIFVKLSS